jgi:hypothetical protein
VTSCVNNNGTAQQPAQAPHAQHVSTAWGTCQQLQSLAIKRLGQFVLTAQPEVQAASQTGQTPRASQRRSLHKHLYTSARLFSAAAMCASLLSKARRASRKACFRYRSASSRFPCSKHMSAGVERLQTALHAPGLHGHARRLCRHATWRKHYWCRCRAPWLRAPARSEPAKQATQRQRLPPAPAACVAHRSGRNVLRDTLVAESAASARKPPRRHAAGLRLHATCEARRAHASQP